MLYMHEIDWNCIVRWRIRKRREYHLYLEDAKGVSRYRIRIPQQYVQDIASLLGQILHIPHNP